VAAARGGCDLALNLGLGAGAALAGALAVSCLSPPADTLSEPDNARTWATTASAVAVFSRAQSPLDFLDGRPSYADASCPSKTDDGTHAVISGGCVDHEGRHWEGQVVLERESPQTVLVTFDGFGSYDDPQWRSVLVGTFVWQQLADDSFGFEAHLEERAATLTSIDYWGTAEGSWDGRSTWSGHGDVIRQGGFGPNGHVRAVTQQEVVDDAACSGQPLSGLTRLDDGRQVAVVTYDGATDCDPDQAAGFSVDGKVRPALTGVGCSFALRLDSQVDWRTGLAMGVGFGLLVWSRRRRRAARLA
jgi:hypothetical protein